MIVEEAQKVLTRHQLDPVAWGNEVIGVRFSGQQLIALRRFTNNLKPNGGTGKMLIKSGHNLGKTWFAAFLAHWFVQVFPYSQVLMMSSSGLQVKERLFAEFRRMYRRSTKRLGGSLLGLSLRLDDKWSVVAVSPNNPDNFQGEHAEHILILFDEAQAVDRDFWSAAEGMIGSSNGCCLGILNPLYTDGQAYENWKKPHEWELLTFNCMDHENVVTGEPIFPRAITRAWVEERKEEWGEDSPLYQARVLGEWPLVSSDTLITVSDLEKALLAAEKNTLGDIDQGTYLSCDIARFGTDFNVIAVLRNGRVIFMDCWSGIDTMATTGRIVHCMDEFSIDPRNVNIDGGGVGGGVVDRLREIGKPVNDIQFGGSPVGDCFLSDKFLNRRAELHWATRMALKGNRLVIPRRFSKAWADLLIPKYKFTSRGQIQVESKEDIKKRVGRSPDWGDAIVMLMARAQNAIPGVTFAR